MSYSHRIIVTDPKDVVVTGGQQDPDTGQWVSNPTPGTGPKVVLQSLADVQQRSESVYAPELGAKVSQQKVEAWLQDEKDLGKVKPEMHVTVRWDDGSESSGTVQIVDRLNGMLVLKGL